MFLAVFFIHKPLHQFFAEDGGGLRICDAGHVRMGEYFFNGNRISFSVLSAAVEKGDTFCIGEELCGSFKAGITAADNRNILTRKKRPITGSAVGEPFMLKGVSTRHSKFSSGGASREKNSFCRKGTAICQRDRKDAVFFCYRFRPCFNDGKLITDILLQVVFK